MVERHVVTALVAKRAEIAGLVVEAERRLEALRADLGHVDAVVRLFDPDAKPETIRAKRPRTDRSGPVTAKLSRQVLDLLRTADRPLTALDLARKVLENAGNAGDEAAEKVLARKVDCWTTTAGAAWSSAARLAGGCLDGRCIRDRLPE